MKKILYFMLAMVLFQTCLYAKKNRSGKTLEPFSFNDRYVLIIASFEDATKDKKFENLGDGIADQLVNEVFEHGKYRLIERKKLDLILEELNFQQSDYLKKDFASKIGEQLGAELMLVGNITEVSEKKNKKSIGIASIKSTEVTISLEARLVLIKTGEIMAISRWSGSDKISSRRALVAVTGNENNTDALVYRILKQGVKQIAYDICLKAPKK